VPGLEEFEGYAPSLNATLTQIVFAARVDPQHAGDLDLFLATRTKPAEPFREPMRLTECSSGLNETDPTLSPDGLELIFVRIGSTGGRPAQPKVRWTGPEGTSHASTSPAVLMRSIRGSLSEPFAQPEVIQIANLPTGAEVTYDSPQVLTNGGDLVVRVTRTDVRGSNSTLYRSIRADAGSSFEPAEELPVFVEQSRHFLSQDGLRAFVNQHYTIQLSCRPSVTARFSAPGKLDVLNATRIGNAEGPVWVSPAEDFLFYSVTTTNNSHQQRRHLRQVRIR
jgi:hypothetical protein